MYGKLKTPAGCDDHIHHILASERLKLEDLLNPGVRDQPRKHSETLAQKQTNKQSNNKRS
jgi:hypothetical protein